MKEEKLMYNNQTVIGENCFFCHDQSHFLTHCSYLRPKIKSTHYTSKPHYRSAHKRGAPRGRKLVVKVRKEREVLGKAEMGVQCDAREEKLLNARQAEFEKVTHLRIYYPELNVDA
jgi:hypothetical protein